MMVNVVMITDKNGNVIQYGGRDNIYETFEEASNVADYLREMEPSCKAYPRRLMRRAK